MAHDDLQRFVDAQGRVYESVLEELKGGQKTGHWMWFIFPQIRGLGLSPTARHFALESAEEAKSYSEHSILGPRLRECTQLVLEVTGLSAQEIFQYPDYLKFRSCMTLFACSAADGELFRQALLKYFDGKPDQRTLDILEEAT